MFKFFDIDDVISNPISPDNTDSPSKIGIIVFIVIIFIIIVTTYRWVKSKKEK